MNNPQILLKDILRLKNDLEAQKVRMPSGLAGMYGEILAYQKLQKLFNKKGFEVIYFSGHKNADIQIKKGESPINIEVKTSRLKKEAPGILHGFGINTKKCKKHKSQKDFCYFDYLICVAIPKLKERLNINAPDNFEKAKFYIFSQNYLKENERPLRNKSRQFKGITHRIIFVECEKLGNKEVTKFDRKLTRTKKLFENNWRIFK